MRQAGSFWTTSAIRFCRRSVVSQIARLVSQLSSRRRRCLRRQQFQLQIAESHLGGAARMKLQGKDAALAPGRIVEVDAKLAVDARLKLIADRHDLVAVPFPRLDVRFARA